MLVVGVKVALQSPPIRSGKRVLFLTIDDGFGCSDLTFFEDTQQSYAHIIKANMNHHTDYVFYTEDEVVQKFYDFLWANGYMVHIDMLKTIRIVDGIPFPIFNGNCPPITINVAGKNFGTFDKLFLEQLPWWKKLIRTRQRIIDPSILFVDWSEDNSLPSLTKCKERANIEGIVTHNALEDAWDVIELLRKFY